MRIISKFKDYYDGAHGWYSPEPVYVRMNEEILYKDLDKETKEAIRAADGLLSVMPNSGGFESKVLIAFCGKAYPCYSHSMGKTFYSTKKMEAYYKQMLKDRDPNFLSAQDRINSLNSRCHWHNLTHYTWERYLEYSFKIPTKAFEAVRSPVFLLKAVGGSIYLEVNPILSKLNFASQVNPYTAFQEIEMYVGNDLVMQMDPNIDRTDDMVRDSKGFNEWSFKKHKDENTGRKKK